MPLLNPGIVVASPYLGDSIWITQRPETVSDQGLSIVGALSRRSYAIVNSAGANELQRVPEGQRSKRVMTFITNAQVRPVSPNAQPDIITWRSDGNMCDFLVYAVDPYPQYGVGWYIAVAVSVDMEDSPL